MQEQRKSETLKSTPDHEQATSLTPLSSQPESGESNPEKESVPQDKFGEPASDAEFKELTCTIGHSGFTLVSRSLPVFGVIFVTLWCCDFWFPVDIRWFGIPAVLLSVPITYFLLRWQESTEGCRLLSFIWHGRPPIVYRRWVRMNDPLLAPGIRFGNLNVAWDAISHAELSFWGNLVLRSFKVKGAPPQKSGGTSSGRKLQEPDVVLKIPFTVASHDDQLALINYLRKVKPDVVLNSRMEKKLSSVEVNGATLVPLLGVVFMAYVLLDVGYSTFAYLEMMKGYYLTLTDSADNKPSRANDDFAGAESIRLHPLPISWVTQTLISKPPVSTDLLQDRSMALWALGRKDEAVESMKKAIELSPKTFRYNLRLARMLFEQGKFSQSEEQIQKAMDANKNSFLPQLYMVALKQRAAPPVRKETLDAYSQYRAQLDEDLFKGEPHWPIGGNRSLHDAWYSEDLDFIFNHLVGKPPIKDKSPLPSTSKSQSEMPQAKVETAGTHKPIPSSLEDFKKGKTDSYRGVDVKDSGR